MPSVRDIILTVCAVACMTACTGRSGAADSFYVTDSGIAICPDSITDADGRVITIDDPAVGVCRDRSGSRPVVTTSSALVNALCHRETAALADSINLPFHACETALLIDARATMPPAGADTLQQLTAALMRGIAMADSVAIMSDRDILSRYLTGFTNRHYNINQGLVAGTPHDYPPAYMPPWFTDNDRNTLLSLSEATDLYTALTLLDDTGGTVTAPVTAGKLAETVRTRLWIPDKAQLSAYLYTAPYPIQLNATDNRASLQALIAGMLSRPMTEAAVARMPVYDIGLPEFYPLPPDSGDDSGSAMTAALRAVAACRVNNSAAVDHALASIMLASVTPGTPRQPAMLTAMLRGVAGLSLSAAGLRVTPSVPSWLNGIITIERLRYGNSTLDITIRGYGDIVSTFAIDNTPQTEQIVPATLTGHHTVSVTLTGASRSHSGVTTVTPMHMPQPPAVTWTSARDASITPTPGTDALMLYVNGALIEAGGMTAYNLYDARQPTWVCIVPLSTSMQAGYSCRPHMFLPQGCAVTLPASSVAATGARILSDRTTTRHRRRTFIKYVPSAYERDIVESTLWHNRTLTFDINLSSGGLYGIDVQYLNGLGVVNIKRGDATRRIIINGVDHGTLSFAQLKPSQCSPGIDWRTLTGYSDMVFVTLDTGTNTIALMTPDTGDGDNQLLIKQLRLIRI